MRFVSRNVSAMLLIRLESVGVNVRKVPIRRR